MVWASKVGGSVGVMSAGPYLSVTDVARLLGVKSGTVSSYHHAGRLPAPDVTIGVSDDHRATYGWLPETIATWQENRPGRGNFLNPKPVPRSKRHADPVKDHPGAD